MVRPMHRFMRRYRKAGLALLAVFTIQMMVAGFCAIPSVQAATIMKNATMDTQCSMDMSMPAGQNTADCTHCQPPKLSTFSNQSNDAPASWTLIAVLPVLLHQTDLASEQEQHLFIVSEAPPRSTSLLYQKTLRIRL